METILFTQIPSDMSSLEPIGRLVIEETIVSNLFLNSVNSADHYAGNDIVNAYKHLKNYILSPVSLTYIGNTVLSIDSLILSDTGLKAINNVYNLQVIQEGLNKSKTHPTDSVATAVLALIGACYLDQGLNVASNIILNTIIKPLSSFEIPQ